MTNSLHLPIYDQEFHKNPFSELLLFLVYISDIPQAADYDLFLYAVNT